MTRLELAGGWYVDAVFGAHVVLYPDSHVGTSQGRVELPPGGNALFLVCTLVRGTLYLACKGHQDGKAWLWDGHVWTVIATETYGNCPVAFGPHGCYVSLPQTTNNVVAFDLITKVRTVTISKELGVRGIAAITGAGLIASDVHGIDYQYGHHGLAEYLDLDGLFIGQGAHGGCVAAGYGELEPGDVQFIRGQRNGDSLVVAMWKPLEKQAVIQWLTVADLPKPAPTPIPVPVPVPVPVPIPEPEPMSGISDRQFATLKAERAKFAAAILTPEEIGTILNATAWTHRDDISKLGMQAKPSGTASVQPKTGTRIWNGLRIIAADGSHWGEDVCGGCSVGQFNPVRADPGPADPASFVAPVEPVHGPVDPPPPPPPPPPPDDDLEALKAALARLETKLDAFAKSLALYIREMDGRVYALENKPPPVVTLPKLRVKGSTGRAFGHGHAIDLPVVPE